MGIINNIHPKPALCIPSGGAEGFGFFNAEVRRGGAEVRRGLEEDISIDELKF